MPSMPTSARASFTSSSLKGLIIASIFFIGLVLAVFSQCGSVPPKFHQFPGSPEVRRRKKKLKSHDWARVKQRVCQRAGLSAGQSRMEPHRELPSGPPAHFCPKQAHLATFYSSPAGRSLSFQLRVCRKDRKVPGSVCQDGG